MPNFLYSIWLDDSVRDDFHATLIELKSEIPFEFSWVRTCLKRFKIDRAQQPKEDKWTCAVVDDVKLKVENINNPARQRRMKTWEWKRRRGDNSRKKLKVNFAFIFSHFLCARYSSCSLFVSWVSSISSFAYHIDTLVTKKPTKTIWENFAPLPACIV